MRGGQGGTRALRVVLACLLLAAGSLIFLYNVSLPDSRNITAMKEKEQDRLEHKQASNVSSNVAKRRRAHKDKRRGRNFPADWMRREGTPRALVQGNVTLGRVRCPKVTMRKTPAYPLFAQVHRNRLAGLLLDPAVLGSFSLLCIVGSPLASSGAAFGSQGQVTDFQEDAFSPAPVTDTLLGEHWGALPDLLDEIRKAQVASPLTVDAKIVTYSDARGSNPPNSDSCISYSKLEKMALSGGGAMSWHDAGVLLQDFGKKATKLLLRPPVLLGGEKEQAACVVLPSHPLAVKNSRSICHIDAFQKPPKGWSEGVRNKFYYYSLMRVGNETMVVLNASAATYKGQLACRLTLRRDAPEGHATGAHAMAPVLLDQAADKATCENPLQYALDFTHPEAADCIERHIGHALSVGADGTWLDGLGPWPRGARTSSGIAVAAHDLRYSTSESCQKDLESALEQGQNVTAKLEAFKSCRFNLINRAQMKRLTDAIASSSRQWHKHARIFVSGLNSSFYWSGAQQNNVTQLYNKSVTIDNAEAPRLPGPFVPKKTESVYFYRLQATRDMLKHDALDGVNMESFFGIVEMGTKCADWPIGANASLESCGVTLSHPGPGRWHANVRVLADASKSKLRALAKVGPADWRSVAQEYLSHYQLDRWMISAYASFLMAVDETPQKELMLGVHPFVKLKNGSSVRPWLHQVFMIDIGRPTETAELLEQYRVRGHWTYLRRFEDGVVLYNPFTSKDVAVPLGGTYLDPWDERCTQLSTWTLAGQSGMVLTLAQ
eukprot:gb/GFBE01068657.1/.p1 GENE.gb/GFBE01068657.1/~~gb/GFBE01068657.1/.p1  ORF type:complete len:776 (+),score=89.83 gb/GFBE01068657.1/:1-2328(+)